MSISGVRKALEFKMAMTNIGTRTNTMPPMVGVPVFAIWLFGPSLRTLCPNLILCRNGMSLGITNSVNTKLHPNASKYFISKIVPPSQNVFLHSPHHRRGTSCLPHPVSFHSLFQRLLLYHFLLLF